MNKFYYLLFFLIFIRTTAQDSLAKYTPAQLGFKSSMATRFIHKPLLWKTYLNGMLQRNPTDSLKAETYYNLSWDIYRYTDYDLNFVINMMKKAIYYGKRANDNRTLLYSFDSLAAFYAMKNDNKKTLQCIEEIKKLHNPNSIDETSYLEYNLSQIYITMGDFGHASSILLVSNKNIDLYLQNHPELSKVIKRRLVYEKKRNYMRLVNSYNLRKKLDSSAFYIKKTHEIEKMGYPIFDNWDGEAFYLVLSKKYDLAIQRIKTAEKKSHIDTKDKNCRAYYYLAMCWQEKKNYTKSLEFCKKGLNIKTKFVDSFINYELELCKIAASNAAKLGDDKKEIYYLKKYSEISQTLDYAGKSDFVTNLYEQDMTVVKDKLVSEKVKTLLSSLLIGILFISLVYIIVHYFKLRKDREKFEDIVLDFENDKLNTILQEIIPPQEFQIVSQQNTNTSSTKISLEVEEKIVKMLNRFEKNEDFLSSNVSLSNMASEFNTNSSYLSAVIKKQKLTTFNGYINDLRIGYIITKLKTSPEYLNYKIAYLAQECGFSSHTVFIRIFTEKTELTPSKFIHFLKNENEELKVQLNS